MGLAINRAIARDLAGIVNRGSFLQHPPCSRWDHAVQVLHLAAVGGDKGVRGIILNRRKTYHCAAVIDRGAIGSGSAERAQVRHSAIAKAESVGSQVIPRVGLSGDLVSVVDRIGDAPGAA